MPTAAITWQLKWGLSAQVIRDGKPCHLYFDIEFVPSCNPDVDGPGLVDHLLAGVARCVMCVTQSPSEGYISACFGQVGFLRVFC